MDSGEELMASAELSGSMETPALHESHEFELVAKNGSEVARKRLRVAVSDVESVTVRGFTVRPEVGVAGSARILAWDTDGVSVEIKTTDGRVVLKDGKPRGTHSDSPTTDTSYVLTASAPGKLDGTAQGLARVTERKAPVINAFSANPNPIELGQSAFLSWEIESALQTRVTIQKKGGQALHDSAEKTGRFEVKPRASERYVLTARNEVGESEAELTLTVNQPKEARILRFEVSPSVTEPGNTVTLAWQVADVDRLVIEEMPAGGASSTIVDSTTEIQAERRLSPTVHTEYKLTVYGQGKENSATTRVQVFHGRPNIVSMRAQPAPVPLGESTELSWTTRNATAVRLLQNDVELVRGLPASGSHTVTVQTATVSLTLVASNPLGESRQTLTVYGHQGPVIEHFTATPASLGSGPTPVHLAWRVRNAAAINLVDTHHANPAGFVPQHSPGVRNYTGSLDLTLNEGQSYTLTASSAAGMATETLSLLNQLAEVEPNNSETEATPVPHMNVNVVGELTQNPRDTTKDVDWFQIQVPVGYTLKVEFFDNQGQCSTQAEQAELGLFTEDDAIHALTTSASSQSPCATLNPAQDSTLTNMTEGRYLLRLRAPFSHSSLGYQLRIMVTAPLCGNGIVEQSELCDDGNQSETDSCSNLCVPLNAPVFNLPGNAQVFTANLPNRSSSHMIALNVTQPSYILAETFTSHNNESCDLYVATQIELLDDQKTVLGFDQKDGVRDCSKIDPSTDAFAALAPGRYWLRTRLSGTTQQLNHLDIRVRGFAQNVCGNGVVENTEQCDDGNIISGDGCSNTCQVESIGDFHAPAVQAETFSGEIDPADSVVRIRMIVQSPVYLGVDVYTDPVARRCTSDIELRVVDINGNQVERDSDSGVGDCPRLTPNGSGHLYTPGTYILEFTRRYAASTVPTFTMVLSTVTANICGNGITETSQGEECDDGNSDPADTCDNSCHFHFNQVYTAPGSRTVFRDLSVPANGEGRLLLTVTRRSHVSIETFSDADTRACPNTEDHILVVRRAGEQTGYARNDDKIPGRDKCSLLNSEKNPAMLMEPGNYIVSVLGYRDLAINSYDIVFESLEADVCGNGIIETGEECDDGNTVDDDYCSNRCKSLTRLENEGAGNDSYNAAGVVTLTPTLSTAGAASTATVATGALEGADNEDFWAVQLSEAGTLDISLTVDGFTSCPRIPSMELTLYAPDGSQVLANSLNSGSEANCPRIYPRFFPNLGILAAGTYYVKVAPRYSSSGVERYNLFVTARPSGCGDFHKLDTEACDDGNTAGGDGCSASCSFEAQHTIAVPTANGLTSESVAIDLEVDGSYVTELTVSQAGYLRLDTIEDAAANTCRDAETAMSLYSRASDGSLTLVASSTDEGVGDCSVINLNTPATAIQPGSYLVVVHQVRYEKPIEVELRVNFGEINRCGNGVLESANSELCDDGNTTAGDGCSATCQLESEQTFTFQPSVDQTMEITRQDGELHRYQLVLSEAGNLFVDLITSNNRCNTYSTGLGLRLLSSTGETLHEEKTESYQDCPSISAATQSFAQLAAGSYYLEVFNESSYAATYRARVRILPAAGCGNLVLNAGEECDDGNSTAGDGCDATCHVEVAQTFNMARVTTSTSTPELAVSTGQKRFIKVTTGADSGWLGVTSRVSSVSSCSTRSNTDVKLELFNEAMVSLVVAKTSYSGCAKISYPEHLGSLLEANHTYWLAVSTNDDDHDLSGITVEATFTLAACGNNRMEPTLSEQCDDGNLVDQDGCSASCEIEALGTHNAGGESTFTGGPIAAHEDAKYLVVVPPSEEAYLWVSSYFNVSNKTCEDDLDQDIDLYLYPIGSNTAIARDDSSGPGYCGLLNPRSKSALRLSAGTYVLKVVGYNNRAIASYGIDVRSVIISSCGDGVIQSGEQCDTGLTTNTSACWGCMTGL